MASKRGKSAGLVGLGALLATSTVWAQADKPRFVILLDNSSSMTQSLAGTETHGDGSQTQPGCNLDGKATTGWAYDDSKLYLSKAAVLDTISAFGAAEFALATYSRTLLGQPCTTDDECTALVKSASCVDLPDDGSSQKYCAYHAGMSYLECSLGTGCTSCAAPADSNDLVFDWSSFDCVSSRCSYAQGCLGGQIVVGFPPVGASNLYDIYRWIDGKEDAPPFSSTSNRELRAVSMTPLASALDSITGWLTDPSKTAVGADAGLLSSDPTARDPRAACRSYSVILITDGEDTCSPNATTDPTAAAKAMHTAGIDLYVVGFGTGFSPALNDMAMNGSGDKRSAYFASNRSELIASLGEIMMNAIPKPRCSCDAICYDEASAFPLKGQPCTVGTGRCKREGVYTCNAAGDGVVCATAAACNATPLSPGSPTTEQCGELAGCAAPTPADCADENCDGNIDEGLSCACTSKPESCNGIDDNCDGIVDNVAAAPCGINLGACKPGVWTCVPDGLGGQHMVCQGPVLPQAEVCDGIDNDCDGVVDGFPRACYPDGVSGCSYDVAAAGWVCTGGCKTGLQTCVAGSWKSCVAFVAPSSELACDGIDNNCDGHVDENAPSASDICYPSATAGCDATSGQCVGLCALGHWICAGNKMGLVCSGSRVPTAELCNSKDDDCDGLIDEDFPTLGQPCNQQSCQGAGQIVCNAAGTGVECSVTATGPTPEVCDGRDNDCDGLVDEVPAPTEPAMPGVGVPCGSAIGECKAGLSVCTDGKIVCNSTGPTPEICDGKDNDCNGSLDDSVVPPGDTCNPDGIPAGQPIKGECRPGAFACLGLGGWRCQGGRGPTQEVCDGKDNDCDGTPDNDALCSDGFICVDGECVPRCQEGGEQYPCSADRYCKDGACIVNACVHKTCPSGFLCKGDGTCVDACLEVTCLPGATCIKGVCVDCYSTGCASGQRCISRQCQADPCASISCPKGQHCKAGSCVPSCAGIACGTGMVCVAGECIKRSCPSACDESSYCETETGECQPKRCSAIACPAGRVCVSKTGRCTDDPCEWVRCPTDQVCVVDDYGAADCAIPSTTPPGYTAKSSSSGGGIWGCSFVAVAGATPSFAWLAMLVPAALALAMRKRRRR